MTAVASAALGEDRLDLRGQAWCLCECALFDGVDADVACLILGTDHKVVGHSGGQAADDKLGCARCGGEGRGCIVFASRRRCLVDVIDNLRG